MLDSRARLAGIITRSDFTSRERGIPFNRLRFSQVLGEWISPSDVADLGASRTREAREVMSPSVATVTEHGTLHRVLSVMLQGDIDHIPIVRV
jgi:CBS-domain-containing membrane protein